MKKTTFSNDPEQLQFFVDSEGKCPVCYTECKYEGYHERDSTYDEFICPKCGWYCMVSDADEIEPSNTGEPLEGNNE